MNKPTEQKICYLGYNKPSSPEEIEFEILGLENAASKIKIRISELRQKKYLADLASKNNLSSIADLFGRENESLHSKDGKEKNHREKNTSNIGCEKRT